jgi:ankyrin repeat protein
MGVKARNSLINAIDEVGDLPLHSAIRGNQTQIAIFLLKSGASTENLNHDEAILVVSCSR